MSRRGGNLQLINSSKNDAGVNHPFGIKRASQRAPVQPPDRLYWSLSNSADKDLKEVAQYLHNAVQWFEAFHALKGFAARNKLRRMVQISTIDRLLQGKYWLPEGTLVRLDKAAIQKSVQETSYHDLKDFDISKDAKTTPLTEETAVFALHADVFQAAHWLLVEKKAKAPCLLNAASSSNPGGGYRRGAASLEENLCRRSSLFLSLEDPWKMDSTRQWSYSIPEFGGIYSPKVFVLRDTETLGYPFLTTPFQVGVVSGAAYAQPAVDVLPDGLERLSKALTGHTRRKIHRLLGIAHSWGHDAVVLPAWGCGVYGNPPAHIAELFRDVLQKEFRNCFRVVVFAMLDFRHVKAFSAVFQVTPGQLTGADGRYVHSESICEVHAGPECDPAEGEEADGPPGPGPPAAPSAERAMLENALARLAAFDAQHRPAPGASGAS